MIRFQRIGRRNDPAFRIVVTEKTASPKAGTYVDLVGSYNPKTKAFSADGERIQEWIGKGAQVSPSLTNLLIAKGVLVGAKVPVVSKKNLEKNIHKEEPAKEEAAAAPVAEPVAEEVAVEEAIAEAEDATEEAPAETPAEEVKEETPTA
ncbi:30S ribosomal protein S16 [Candidatus Parcubacteria bacterium]|nr:30S ribosomal protein S16 [Candidatus Parcubacteria bacterium]